MIKTDNRWIYAEQFCKYKGLDYQKFLSQDIVKKQLDQLILAYDGRRSDFVQGGKISWELAPNFAVFTGEKSICKQPEIVYTLQDYLDYDTQLELSKRVNALKIASGGVKAAARYNKRSSINATGFRPSDLKILGKAKGLPSKDYATGKEFIRKQRPHFAAIMAVADDFSLQGFNEPEALRMAKSLEHYFLKKSGTKW